VITEHQPHNSSPLPTLFIFSLTGAYGERRWKIPGTCEGTETPSQSASRRRRRCPDALRVIDSLTDPAICGGAPAGDAGRATEHGPPGPRAVSWFRSHD
jgi:hypothetical protein